MRDLFLDIIWNCRCFPSFANKFMLKDLEGIIPSCSGEKLVCANEIKKSIGMPTEELNVTIQEALENPGMIGNVTEPEGMM